ncbi:MAG: WD40 repeat protein, partial [Planctomycetota bacterium]
MLAWSADRPFHATISPDDRWLAVANYGTGSRNHKIRLFDARTGDDVIALEGLAKHARVYFSYDSSQMVVSDMQGKRVDLWQVGEWTRTLVGEVPPGFDLYDVSGDGTSIQIEQPALEAITRAHPLRNELWVARTDGQLVCIDASTGRSLRVWKHDNASLTALAIHPQGELIATYDEAGVLRLVSAASGRLVAEHSGSAPKLAKWDAPKLAFSPDGSALLLQLPRIHARVYDADDLKVRWEHPYTSRSRTWSDRCAWSPDGRLLALVTDECEVALFDAENGDESIPRISTDARIEPISFQPKSGSLWVGTDASKVQVFDHRTGEAIRSIDHSRLDPFGFEFGSITFRADGAVAVTASSGYGIVAAWDTKSFTRLWKYDFGGGNPACLLNQFGQDGALIYVWGQGDGTSLILDAASGKTVLSPSNRNAHELIPLAGEAVFGAQGWYQLAVLDIKEGQSRWQRHEVTGGGWILRSPSGHFDASGQALDRCTIVTDEAQASYEALASVLLDPKRVRAAAAGVPLRRVMMPKLPELSWSVPQPREFTLAPREAAPDLTLVASSPEGVRGFEVRVDGVSNTFAGKPRSKTERELVLDIERPTSSQEIDYRIRPIGMNGVLG